MPVEVAIALAGLRQRSFAELGDSTFWRRSTAQLERVMPSLDERGREVLVTARNEIEDRWGGASLPMGQCHGDWIPPNMSVARDGSYTMWDWELSDGDHTLGIDPQHFIFQRGATTGPRSKAPAPRFSPSG